MSFVTEVCNSKVSRCKVSYVLKEKMKHLKGSLRTWNREIFGYLDLEIEKAISNLNHFLKDGESNHSSSIDRVHASNRVWESIIFKESILCQKSKQNWLKEGKSNSRLFHKAIRRRFQRNKLVGLLTDKGKLEFIREVKGEIKKHFEYYFKECIPRRPLSEGVEFNRLSLEESDSLESSFSEHEIKDVVWSGACHKSLTPDGFSFNFFKE